MKKTKKQNNLSEYFFGIQGPQVSQAEMNIHVIHKKKISFV